MKYSLMLIITTMMLSGCQKELSLENGTPAVPEKETRKYQLRAFYSDKPIDFDESDNVVKSETDLWEYVNDYLKDDVDEFAMDSTEVLVYQNEKKIPGNDAPVLSKSYFIGTDAEGMYMKFLGPQYEPLRYRLQEMNDEYFIIYIKWRHGSTVFSRFERIR
jgi:hypothetical protein